MKTKKTIELILSRDISIILLFSIINNFFPYSTSAQTKHETEILKVKAGGAVWIPDNGDGTYTNPIIDADYSDPDVIRVNDDFYMTSSSFSHFPGLPILYSKDLVNWRIIGHAVQNYPYEIFNKPQHGNGIWAPSIRYHDGQFYIYFGDPDNGVFMTKTKNPAGLWEPLKLIRSAKGWIDVCPFWDNDGNAYIIHAWANSRSGIKSILTVNKMSSDGTKILDDGITVFDGHAKHPTIEGPKLYKRNGYYYIFAPAGGVKTGWQLFYVPKMCMDLMMIKLFLNRAAQRLTDHIRVHGCKLKPAKIGLFIFKIEMLMEESFIFSL